MNNVNLGKYNLQAMLRNPALIHQIQDRLTAITEGGILGAAIQKGARDNIQGTIRMIVSQYRDNPKLLTEIVGAETLALIEEFTGQTLADDLKDVL